MNSSRVTSAPPSLFNFLIHADISLLKSVHWMTLAFSHRFFFSLRYISLGCVYSVNKWGWFKNTGWFVSQRFTPPDTVSCCWFPNEHKCILFIVFYPSTFCSYSCLWPFCTGSFVTASCCSAWNILYDLPLWVFCYHVILFLVLAKCSHINM